MYTGAVHPGGPPAVRELDRLTITKVSVGPMDNNAYLLRDHASGDLLLIDAANDGGRLLQLIDDAPVRAIVTTHRHADHWQALAEVRDRTGAPVIAHRLDAAGLPVPVDRAVRHGEQIGWGDSAVTVIHLRGHTPGAIALRYDDDPGRPAHLFTGDSLFPGGPGRTANPADFHSLMNDLQERVFDTMPDDTWFYPGHGDDSTLGAERPHLAEWRARGW